MAVALLVPAYNPDRRLLSLIETLRASGRFCGIVVVDDGSRKDCQPLFARLAMLPGVIVLRHAANLGKGAALKTGLNHVCWTLPHCEGVVTTDADGQHLAHDVLRVAGQLESTPNCLILGSRCFTGAEPWRSRLGNLITKYAFWALVGKRVRDTQCGLRGIPLALARELLHLKDSGYEFELDMLIHCKHARVPIVECPIATVYLEGNRGSHFNPLLDSLRIYWVLLRFMAASLATAAVDYLVFVVVYGMAGNILLAQGLARLLAGGLNFSLVHRLVFHCRARVAATLWKYVVLVLVMGATSYSMIQTAILALGCNVILAKLTSELIVYIANFAIQRDLVFQEARANDSEPPQVQEQPEARRLRRVA